MMTASAGLAPVIGSPSMRVSAFILCCLAAAPAAAKDITVTATPVPLSPNDRQRTTIDSLEYVAGLALDSPAVEWGGYSGMVMASDGSSLLAVSDTGHWLALELRHDAAGRLTGAGAARIEPLLDEAGRPLAGKEWSDAEAIALGPDGEFVVAFERRHRIWRYAAADGVPHGPAQPALAPDAIGSLPENAGVEALAVESDGTWLLIAEDGAIPGRGSRGWIGNDRAWAEIAVERSDGFEPTALARSADGKTLLLERRYTEADGPAARVSLLPSPFGSRIVGFTLGVLRRPLSVDNFEAMALRQAPDGATDIYLLADDNQADSQRTLLLQFRTRLE
jgi:hypothetical protein